MEEEEVEEEEVEEKEEEMEEEKEGAQTQSLATKLHFQSCTSRSSPIARQTIIKSGW